MIIRILFVSHKEAKCGVYEFGKCISDVLDYSTQFQFIRVECFSLAELKAAIAEHQPTAIIYNYHPSVMPWLCTKISKGLYRNNISGIKAIQLGIVHEITQYVADNATAYRNRYITGTSLKKLNTLFDFYIAPDPTLLLKNPLVFKTGRLILKYNKEVISPAITTIGSFGFATPKKGFELLVRKVQEEFEQAIIRINMPAATFGDRDGRNARKIAENCRNIITDSKIKLEISHEYLNNEQLLDFLAGNSINVFMYEDKTGRGISSAVDNALAVKKPIAVSRCPMFRHVLGAKPSICVEDVSLRTILKNGFAPLEKISKNWDAKNLLWDYERILNAAMYKTKSPSGQSMGVFRKIKSVRNKLFSLPDGSFTWLRNTDAANDDNLTADTSITYRPVTLPSNKGLNIILDDEARNIYQPAVEKLFELAPSTMAKKITRANVQQAFVFDTVHRLMKNYTAPKLLCVGSYEDTASMALQKMGCVVDEIDPMINFFLQEFYTKPSTVKNSYDIIFSTSVIEHDPDDKSFIECIEGLLSVNGIAVITCDYKDGWKAGDPKPEVNARLYTKNDLEKRLLSYLPDSVLVDKPEWECPNPDFNYLGKYQYSFASFVFRKIK
ncbi:MAG: hypothetical protein ABIT07_03265 [Ferruginibacter sp.]